MKTSKRRPAVSPTRGAGKPKPAEHTGPAEGEVLFREYLAGQHLKLTRTRFLVLREVLSSPEHFGADDLHLRFVHKKIPVSRATIYRTLEHLIKSGLVRRVYLDRKNAFFEHVHRRQHHEHMICLSCGKVIEFSDDPLERRQEKVCRDWKFKPMRHSLRIVGLCEKCQ
ncbi:MAG: Fur family transcriptional regulator [Acidobacteriota bacterium]